MTRSKIKKLLGCFFIFHLFFSSSCTLQAQQSRLRLSGGDVPQSGTVLELMYNPKGGPLEKSTHVEGIVYMYINYRWSLSDVVLTYDSACWKGVFRVPDSCAMFAFKFIEIPGTEQEISDNNGDSGYVYVCIDESRKRLPGGNLGWGLFRKPSLQKAIPGYFLKYEISDDAMRMWVSKEVNTFPQYIGQYFDSYIAAIKLSKEDDWTLEAEKKITRFLQEPWLDERHYKMVHDLYRFELNDKAKADSLEKRTLLKYPAGITARAKAYYKAYFREMNDTTRALMEDFLQTFPPNVVYANSELQFQRYMYYNVFKSLGTAYMASKMEEKLKALIRVMDFSSLNETYRWNISGAFTLSLLPVERLYPISEELIKNMLVKQSDGAVQDGIRYSPAQANRIARSQLNDKLSFHVRMLVKMHKYKEAEFYISKITEEYLYVNADLNEAHVMMLKQTGKYEQMFSTIEISIRNNAATTYMLDVLKERYVKQHGSDKEFGVYMESLKSSSDVEKVKSYLISKLTNIKIDFLTLSGMNGITLTPQMLKGKIVVLDFWATWCFPCKMAFPGMQLAVDKYAEDPSIDFYFIATMERSKHYKEEIKRYMKNSGFRFNVLYDAIHPKTNEQNGFFSTMAALFNSSAIPRKVILKDGFMRYTSEGFEGSSSKLMDEISYVIEILKAENK